jgi:TonB family protein
MKAYLIGLIFLLGLYSCSNNKKKDYKVNEQQINLDSTELIESIIEEECDDNIDIFYVVEEMPEFGNGWEDIRKHILDNIEYPQTAIDDSLEGKVYIQFVINEKGKVTEARVIRGVRYDLDNESLRVVNEMPDWKPGKQRGIPVKVWYTLPFYFSLNSDSENSKGNVINTKKKTEDKSIELKIYPNPATDYVNIEILDSETDLEYQLINTKGQICITGRIYNSQVQINIAELTNGLYIVRLFSKEKGLIKTEKLIKK